jgi:mono/diheme cytochrome c family protein
VAVVIMVAVGALAIAVGAPLEAKADPNSVGYVPRPEWYFLDMFQMLWYVSGPAEPLIIFLAGTLGFLVFIALPFIDRSQARHFRQRPIATVLGILVVAGIAGLTAQGALAPVASIDTTVQVDTTALTPGQKLGLKVYQVEGCASCHMLAGRGGTAGPDLSHVAAKLTGDQIQQQILKPRDKMPPYADISTDDMANLIDFLSTMK